MTTYLTVAEVATLTGYKPATVRAKFNSGELPGYRPNGGQWRATESEIRAAIEGKPVTPRGAKPDINAIVRAGLNKAAIVVARQQDRQKRLAAGPKLGTAQPQQGGG